MKNDRLACPRNLHQMFPLIELAAASGRQRRAFTLIELLAVIGVIAILAAMLFPLLTSATEKGNKARCMSNLKQWGVGIMLFLSENNGSFPQNGTLSGSLSTTKATAWFNVIPPFMGTEPLSNLVAVGQAPGPQPPFNKNIFTCPSLRGSGGGTNVVMSYAYNQSIDVENRTNSAFGQRLRLSQIRTNAQFIVFGEIAQTNSDILVAANLVYRHDGGKRANVCFADGHVSSIEASSLTNTLWDP